MFKASNFVLTYEWPSLSGTSRPKTNCTKIDPPEVWQGLLVCQARLRTAIRPDRQHPPAGARTSLERWANTKFILNNNYPSSPQLQASSRLETHFRCWRRRPCLKIYSMVLISSQLWYVAEHQFTCFDADSCCLHRHLPHSITFNISTTKSCHRRPQMIFHRKQTCSLWLPPSGIQFCDHSSTIHQRNQQQAALREKTIEIRFVKKFIFTTFLSYTIALHCILTLIFRSWTIL